MIDRFLKRILLSWPQRNNPLDNGSFQRLKKALNVSS